MLLASFKHGAFNTAKLRTQFG